jgi:SAM-dependent methyltransferase
MTTEISEKMMRFWSERAKLYGMDPRANTNDVWLREVEINYVNSAILEYRSGRVLDFGCANGFTTARLAELNPNSTFLGIDINQEMIDASEGFAGGQSNLSFGRFDVLQDTMRQQFDFIYAIRVFQNIEGLEKQKMVVDRLCDLVLPGGIFLYIESYVSGYAKLNEDRLKMRLTTLPIHEHLTLLTDEFDQHVSKRMRLLKKESLASSYYLITRLLYSYIAKMNNEPIDYNHPIHQVAAIVPQIGEYGPLRACIYKKA